jgi:hypothetical protein
VIFFRRHLAVWLPVLALVMWLLSLVLPSFSVGPESTVWLGGKVLLYGLGFGWLCSGWAAYANVFFLVAAVRLFLGKAPTVSTLLMVVFAATLPLFKGVPRDEGTGVVLFVSNWGAGLWVWLTALGCMATACVDTAISKESATNAP